MMRPTRAVVVATLVGVAVVVVLTADVLLSPRVGPPLWTCMPSAPPTAVPRTLSVRA